MEGCYFGGCSKGTKQAQQNLRGGMSSAGSTQDNTFHTVSHQRRRNVKKRIGTAAVSDGGHDASGSFRGVERRVWLYLNRIPRTVTAEAIKDYIKKKPTFDSIEVSVTELPTGPSQNKCFVVAAPFQKKDLMYQPDFWPCGVGVKRFDFKRHPDYVGNSRGPQPSSFA